MTDTDLMFVTAAQHDLIQRTVATGATADELALYLYDCQRQRVHPLDKLIHFTKRGGRYTPVTSIDLMRTRAADSGEYAGSDDAVFVTPDTGVPVSATVTVYRIVQGFRCAFTATARWAEYCPESSPMWRRMGHTMLAKCAEALALRKGFPRSLAGLYAAEEMDQADRGVRDMPGDSETVPAGYADWVTAMGLIADTGNFTALVATIKDSPIYKGHLRSKDPATWWALKARQEAVVAPAGAAVQTLREAGIPVRAATVTVGEAAPFRLVESAQAADGYAAGIARVRAAVRRTGKGLPS